MTASTPDYSALENPLLRASLAAGLATLAVRRSGEIGLQLKEDETPVTRADHLSDRILRETLPLLLPGSAWLSEETVDDRTRLQSEAVWIVDPIDGTREFAENLDEYSVSAGLSWHGKAALGCVVLPPEGRLMVGGPGIGLRHYRFTPPSPLPAVGSESSYDWLDLAAAVKLEATPAAAPAAQSIEGARLMVSRSEMNRGVYGALREHVAILPTGSIARKLALLAAGDCDMVFSIYPKSEWDICAGVALSLSRPGFSFIEMESGALPAFNRAAVRSFGLCAGPAALVAELLRLAEKYDLRFRRSYD